MSSGACTYELCVALFRKILVILFCSFSFFFMCYESQRRYITIWITRLIAAVLWINTRQFAYDTAERGIFSHIWIIDIRTQGFTWTWSLIKETLLGLRSMRWAMKVVHLYRNKTFVHRSLLLQHRHIKKYHNLQFLSRITAAVWVNFCLFSNAESIELRKLDISIEVRKKVNESSRKNLSYLNFFCSISDSDENSTETHTRTHIHYTWIQLINGADSLTILAILYVINDFQIKFQ